MAKTEISKVKINTTKLTTKQVNKPLAKQSRDIEKSYTRTQFAEKLRRFAEAIETGKAFRIQVANQRLNIPSNAIFNIEHEQDKGNNELEFQIKWISE